MHHCAWADKCLMSGEHLRRFIPRATRYILRPKDHRLLKFANDSKDGSETQETTFVNLSRTGLAFLIERDMAPQLGDLIKVEFQVPAGTQIAWWARTVRIEEYSKQIWWIREDPAFRDLILIGLEFQELPEGHQLEIQRGLDIRFREMLADYRREQVRRLWSWVQFRGWKYVAYLVLAAAVFGALYWLSLPSANYDAHRGSPWGERFQIF